MMCVDTNTCYLGVYMCVCVLGGGGVEFKGDRGRNEIKWNSCDDTTVSKELG